MSNISVALFGHNGHIGQLVLRNLATASGVDLKVFHRASSDVSGVPDAVKRIVIDLKDEDDLAEHLVDTDVVVSTIGNAGQNQELAIARAAKRSQVKRYIPSFYTSDQIEDDTHAAIYDAVGGGHIARKYRFRREIEKLGVPTTFVYTGLFADYALTFGFVLPSIGRNAGTMTENILRVPYPISSFQHVAEGIAALATRQPYPLPDAPEFVTLIEFSPTGQELIEALTRLNGEPPQITFVTDEELAKRKSGEIASSMPFFKLMALMWENWSTGKVIKADESVLDLDRPKRSLLDFMRELKENPPAPPTPPTR